MTASPLVLVSTDIKELDGYRWHAAPNQYVQALVTVSRATPVLMPCIGAQVDIAEMITRFDGVLLTGSRSNVHPPHYGHEPLEIHEPFDLDRDATTLELARAAVDAGIPLFAICRGHQELNVAFGGTIEGEIQERDDRIDHRAPESTDNDVRFQLAHTVSPVPGGVLHRILGGEEIRVNSLHRQAIGELAPRLQVEATAEDGTVEATSVRDAASFALSVQWHPEYWAGREEVSDKLFTAFGDACRARTGARAPQAA